MRRNYKRKRNSKRSRTSKRRATSVRRRPSKSFVKKVQTVINKNSEDKQAYTSIVNVNYNSAINSSADINFIIPNISTGTEDNQRIGDQLRAKLFKLDGHIITNLTFTSYSACRIGVRVMVVQPKMYRSQDVIISNATGWLSTLLKKGGTTNYFTGVVSDLYAPINTDTITTYYDKLFYMRTPYVPGSVTNDLNTASSTKFFRFHKNLKNKLLRYDDTVGAAISPVDWNPVLLVGYAKLDSGTPDTITTEINLNWVSTLDYQDM